MKKAKFITLPIIMMVLTGCGIVPSKAPTFSKYKNEVDYEKICEDYDSLLSSTHSQFEAVLSSTQNFTEKRNLYTKITSSLRRSKKEVGTSEYVDKTTITKRYDIHNNLCEESSKIESSNEAKFPTLNIDDKSDSSSSIFYQLEQAGDQYQVYAYNNKDKSCYRADTNPKFSVENYFFAALLTEWYSTILPVFRFNVEDYKSYDDTKYYSDDRVLTIVTSLDSRNQTGDGTFTVDAADKVKVQICDEEDTHRLSINRKSVRTYNFTTNCNFYANTMMRYISILEGDKYTMEALEYIEITIKKDKFSLNRKDLSKYINAE